MAPLGPFEPDPQLAVAVSGGADSLALALLAQAWASARGGRVTALVVDHGLRDSSAAEARLTCRRLAGQGISACLLSLDGLARGPGLAARARAARYARLEAACRAAGIVHLLLGHHAGDQAETLAMRQLDRSHAAGLAGMAGLVEGAAVRRLRPLLGVAPWRLRATLRAAGLAWVEDPSNADPAALRARLRRLRGDRDGDGPLTRAALAAALLRGRQRASDDAMLAQHLAVRARIYPEGYAILTPGAFEPAALSALLRMLAANAYPPALSQVSDLARELRPATLAGVRIQPAGRLLAGGWLLTREVAAMAAPVPAVPGACWDGRFRFDGAVPPATQIGALGAQAAALRGRNGLPASVLQTLPALRLDGRLFAVPHLGYYPYLNSDSGTLRFDPGLPAAGAPFATACFDFGECEAGSAGATTFA